MEEQRDTATATATATARRKLWPKSPSGYGTGFSKGTGKTQVPSNPRDRGLTESQQSWARALTASLSGWRAGCTVAQDREHDVSQTEDAQTVASPLPARTSRRPWKRSRRATCTASVSDDARAHQHHARSAAEWAHKVRMMQIAGTGDKEIVAWDHVSATYIRDYALEERKARLRAAFAGQGEGDAGGESERDRDGDGDSDNDSENESERRLAGRGALHVIVDAQSLSESTSLPSPDAPQPDWRVKARKGLERKKLTIDKGWSAVTWNQKSNIQERLLLLEDEGVEIAGLRERIGGPGVTRMILERAAGMVQQGERTEGDNVGREESAESKGTEDVGVDKGVVRASSPVRGSSRFEQDLHGSVSVHEHLALASNDSPVVDDYQPFDPSQSYQPQTSHRLKRKRTHDSDDEDPSDSPRKKRRTSHATDSQLAQEALQRLKHTALRLVFAPARSNPQNHSPQATIIFTPSRHSTNSAATLNPLSSLEYLHNKPPHPSLHPDTHSLTIPTRGFTTIMHELHFLANAQDTEMDLCIRDPDFDAALISAHAQRHTTAAQIRISTTHDGSVVFRGETRMLVALCRVLREQALLHCVDWEWDGVVLGVRGGVEWSLGPGTMGALVGVEEVLGRFGGGEVVVQRLG